MTDFYEDDEPIEEIEAILDRPPDGVTAPPAGNVATVGPSRITGPCAHGGSCEYAHTGYAWTCAHRYVTA